VILYPWCIIGLEVVSTKLPCLLVVYDNNVECILLHLLSFFNVS